MLKITIQPRSAGTTFALEGQLDGATVTQFEKLWRRIDQEALYGPVQLNLTSVHFVDPHGKELLKRMHEHGAELIAEDHLMKSVVEEITGRDHIGRPRPMRRHGIGCGRPSSETSRRRAVRR
ncbi:STAS domain-containing protein [Candidatus Nitrospira bockiana]